MINSKKKGARGELEFSKFLQSCGFEARRTQQYCGNTGDASDVTTDDEESFLNELHIEVKRVEKLNINEAYEQAERDAHALAEKKAVFKFPIVAHRKSRKPWLVTLSARDFFLFFGKQS